MELLLNESRIKGSRVLVVDDHADNVALLQGLLASDGYVNVRGVTEPTEALVVAATWDPDLVALDLRMPRMDGFEVMQRLQAMQPPTDYLPILILTASTDRDERRRALAMGAKDFVTKPFDATEVLLRIHNLLETRLLHRSLKNQNMALEERVAERTRALEDARLEILQRLAVAAEYRDDITGEHTLRVGRLAKMVAEEMRLSPSEVDLISKAAPLHDVGKIGVPDRVLLKPGQLELSEFERMKSHTQIGARILSGSSSPLLQTAEAIALSHHERWDGTGYPTGMRRDDIPLAGRIVAVADVFDALVHDRPYKRAWTAGKPSRRSKSRPVGSSILRW